MLVNKTITDFVGILASDAPAPGGGSVSALSGALASGLLEMVAALTVTKAKYAEFHEEVKSIASEASLLRTNFLELIDKDTEAYNGVTAVFAMPKATDEEKKARKEAMQTALKQATMVPFEILQTAEKAVLLAKKSIGKTNTNAYSDLGVSAAQLSACAQGAFMNVKINLSGISDENFTSEYLEKSNALLKSILESCEAIVTGVCSEI